MVINQREERLMGSNILRQSLIYTGEYVNVNIKKIENIRENKMQSVQLNFITIFIRLSTN